MTVAEFCRRNAVSRVGLFAWKRQLREDAAGAGGAGAFVAVEAAPDPVAAIILELSGGVQLRLRAGFHAELLRQVVRGLEPLARLAGCRNRPRAGRQLRYRRGRNHSGAGRRTGRSAFQGQLRAERGSGNGRGVPMNPGAAGPASGICIAAFSFYALWLALDTPRALSAMARVLGAAYFWLPGRRRIVAVRRCNVICVSRGPGAPWGSL